jgi:predicted metalloprotease with PDZ domain
MAVRSVVAVAALGLMLAACSDPSPGSDAPVAVAPAPVAPVRAPAAADSGPPLLYEVALDGRAHHEARIQVTFRGLADRPLEVRMSRTSPGRYALHEFAKNVYAVSAVDGRGRALPIARPDLHEWDVSGHDGTVVFRYTLFGDRSDGTYAAIDSTHAHLNVPASFVWARGLEGRAVEVKLAVPDGWTLATQLEARPNGVLFAPNLAYFIDSPIEASAAERFAWTVGEGASQQTIELALHHSGKPPAARALADLAKLVVDEQIALFGEAPRFDFGRYTFLADALDWVDGDGMEHRNSTVLTMPGSVEERIDALASNVSHEFFHAWNVERIRPRSLEPFDLEQANVSEELWFAEGFTTYYGDLVLARIGAIDLEHFAEILGRHVNQVLNSPGTALASPREMSFQAPFVDAATANEPTNRGNTFLSYYTYGAALGAALDLTIRRETAGLTLDDFMRAAWTRFGAPEQPYTNTDLRQLLGEVTGNKSLADAFFARSIDGTQPPDFASLLADVGLRLRPRHPKQAWLGATDFEYIAADETKKQKAGARLTNPPRIDSPLYRADVGRDDLLLRIGEIALKDQEALDAVLRKLEPGRIVELVFEKRGQERNVRLEVGADPELELVTFEAAGEEVTEKVRSARSAWLAPKAKPRLEVVRYCPETGHPQPYRFRHCPIHGEPLQLAPRDPAAKPE